MSSRKQNKPNKTSRKVPKISRKEPEMSRKELEMSRKKLKKNGNKENSKPKRLSVWSHTKPPSKTSKKWLLMVWRTSCKELRISCIELPTK